MTIAGANVHDTKLLAATLDAIVVERPEPTSEQPQHLCLDKGYDNPTGRQAAEAHHYETISKGRCQQQNLPAVLKNGGFSPLTTRFEIVSYCSLVTVHWLLIIASVGQTSAHAPQSVHFSGSMT